ncbi:MAG TPA: hypothetical protein VHW23_29760 [Kofleriaceae bacterium]|nr:hypothetical protein [Kofleriaceae bacterium]
MSRTKIYEVLERTAGKDVAFAASAQLINRTFDMEFGNGSLSWITQLWPFPAIAAAATTGNSLSWAFPGQQKVVAGTDRPLTIGPATPWQNLPANKQVTCFLCGNNETHTKFATSTNSIGGNSLLAGNAALQAALPAVIPTVTVGQGTTIGTAPGATTASNVGNGDGIVDLFNSTASRAGGLLASSKDAANYKAFYQGFIQLNRAANRPTTNIGYTTATGAAQFLGTNLSSKLAVTPDDLTRYGITGTTRSTVTALGRTMIIAVKAYSLGLTNGVVVPGFNDDPHGAFDGGDVNTVPAQMKGIFDGFMTDLQNTLDANTQKPLADNIVITIKGDTFKSPTNKAGWGDGTPQNTNAVYVYSSGQLLSGWFGDISAAGAVQGVGADGKLTTYNGANTAKYALASVLYATAIGDDRAIQGLASGVQVSGIFGRAKQI